ncbi:hypothetical protein [Pseudodonghicola flavimaris]|uniref:Uncharacterized protein n=1 Tax=Pseudodonghicola flavimaris TaxID=3050036 RepID=A0ABT7EXE6_9RHOB|nr:hypothetical protein [Pseudodonghicola flavimaris]MDK3016998.1 hypothetical protein [Pseudodonghicola flavimaris]
MSAYTCSSRTQCRRNGLFGTAVALSAMILGWSGVELASGAAEGATVLWGLLRLWLLPLLPCVLSVGLWAGLRFSGRAPGRLATALAIAGAGWGVVALNAVVRL